MNYNGDKRRLERRFAEPGVMEDIPEIRDLDIPTVEEDLPGVEVRTAFKATSKGPKLRG